MTIEQSMQIAVRHHQGGRLAEAETMYRQILGRQPNHADALHLLGVLACQTGHFEGGVDLIRRAIALRPNWHEAHSNLGNALRAKGQLGEAIAAYRQAIAIRPNSHETYSNFSVSLLENGQVDEAIAACRQAIAIRPDHPEAHSNLGNALEKAGHLDEAIAAYRQAVALRPDYPEAYSNLGNVLRDKGLFDEAIAACRRALALRPRYSDAYNHLGAALRDKGQLDEAVAACRQAIAIRPDFPEAHCNLGNALREARQLSAATAAYRKAVALRPEFAEARSNLAMILLLQGDFQGWSEYEWRWKSKGFTSAVRNFAQPMWGGEDLHGRTILLHAEQGLGDTIQFVRYASHVSDRGGNVILECQAGLSRLLERLPGVTQLLTVGETPPDFDLHCPLLSLPRAFGTRLESIPGSVPYLSADAGIVEAWAGRVPKTRQVMKVGLAWAGNPAYPNDRKRSIALKQFARLAGVDGVEFHSLQKGPAASQAVTDSSLLKVNDWSEQLTDFAETAALIHNMDLVISVDTAVAHLAGALGKPVWLLLPFMPDWRWMLDRDDSPWYPTMRLFRQKAIDQWDEVIQRVAECLTQLVLPGL